MSWVCFKSDSPTFLAPSSLAWLWWMALVDGSDAWLWWSPDSAGSHDTVTKVLMHCCLLECMLCKIGAFVLLAAHQMQGASCKQEQPKSSMRVKTKNFTLMPHFWLIPPNTSVGVFCCVSHCCNALQHQHRCQFLPVKFCYILPSLR